MRKYIILFLVILGFTIIYNYNLKSKYTPLLCNNTHFIDDFNTYISNIKIPLSEKGHQFSYTFDIKFLNLPENSQWYTNVNYKKPILYRNGSPNINYYPKTHILEIEMTYRNEYNEIDFYKIHLANLRIQKWINMSIILDNRFIDIFIDNKHYTSAYLPNVPFIYNKNIYLGEKDNNFNGYIKNMKYYNYAIKH